MWRGCYVPAPCTPITLLRLRICYFILDVHRLTPPLIVCAGCAQLLRPAPDGHLCKKRVPRRVVGGARRCCSDSSTRTGSVRGATATHIVRLMPAIHKCLTRTTDRCPCPNLNLVRLLATVTTSVPLGLLFRAILRALEMTL